MSIGATFIPFLKGNHTEVYLCCVCSIHSLPDGFARALVLGRALAMGIDQQVGVNRDHRPGLPAIQAIHHHSAIGHVDAFWQTAVHGDPLDLRRRGSWSRATEFGPQAALDQCSERRPVAGRMPLGGDKQVVGNLNRGLRRHMGLQVTIFMGIGLLRRASRPSSAQKAEDFRIYRRLGRQVIPLIAPPRRSR